jgi:hypothetical protein
MTYPADDVLMIREMRLAVLTSIDLSTIKVCVVSETHGAVRTLMRSMDTKKHASVA